MVTHQVHSAEKAGHHLPRRADRTEWVSALHGFSDSLHGVAVHIEQSHSLTPFEQKRNSQSRYPKTSVWLEFEIPRIKSAKNQG